MKAKGDAMSQHVAPCRESRVKKTVQEKGLQQEFPPGEPPGLELPQPHVAPK